MDTDSAIDLSQSASSSLSDRLPDLRKSEEPRRMRTRADSLSSALSSIIDSDASSDLSDLDSDEEEKPSRKRQRKEYSPEPLSESEDSADEVEGVLKPGKKRYLKAGLYSAEFKDEHADATFSVEIHKSSCLNVLSAVPLALAASVPAEATDDSDSAVEDIKPRESRRASSVANQKFARNGAGPSNLQAKQKAPKKKPLPASTVRSNYAPTGPILPLPEHYGETLMNQQRDFKLAFDILRDYRQGSIGRQRVYERAGAAKRPPKYMQLKQSQYFYRGISVDTY